jgi:competence protein ComEC
VLGSSPPRSFHRSRWFLRRPCFWLALSAWSAAAGSVAFHLPPPLWLGLGVLGLVAGGLGQPGPGGLAAAAALFGCLAWRAVTPVPDPEFRPGMPVTVRGRVVSHRRLAREHGEKPGQQLICELQWSRQPSGWTRRHGRVGAVLEDSEPLEIGSEVELAGTLTRPPPATNPGEASPRLRWQQQGVHLVLRVRPFGARELGYRPEGWLSGLGRTYRARILDLNRGSLSSEAAHIANSFLIGDSDPPYVEEAGAIDDAFRRSGTIHLLVVSGTQVTLVLGLFLLLGWRFWAARAVWWLLGAVSLGMFWITTDGSASVLRAGVMGFIWVLALLLDREPDLENSLGVAALVLLGVQTLAPFDIGAQLTFAAVWGLARLGGPLAVALGPLEAPEDSPQSTLRHLHRWLAGLAASSIAAHLAVAPVLAFHFQQSAWIALAANLILVPLASVYMFVSLAHLLLAALGIPLLTPLATFGADALLGWARLFALPALGAREVFPAPDWLVVGTLAALAVPSVCRFRRVAVGAWTFLIAGALLCSELWDAPPPQTPTVRALDIGQGDCLLLQGTDGTNVLMDTGPPDPHDREPRVPRLLRALRVASLDAVLLSHVHADHTGGLEALLHAFPVRNLLAPDVGDPEAWAPLLRAAEANGVRLHRPRTGDTFRMGSTQLRILGPPTADPGATADVNNGSLVVCWEQAGMRVLLTGDLEREGEERLLRSGVDLRADLLKVPHHGSRSASSTELLKAVAPRFALISCGRSNRFGHPHTETLKRMDTAGVPVWRTDRSGMLRATGMGRGLRVRPFVDEPSTP